MDRAIVKQSTLENGVVTVRIPNSVLQSALTLKAYVGIYEGETFKVIETIEIPIIAKAKPADYSLEDSDEEIYSFNALNNRISNIIANNNPTDGNSELVDLRTDYKGTTHASAGDATRFQTQTAIESAESARVSAQTAGAEANSARESAAESSQSAEESAKSATDAENASERAEEAERKAETHRTWCSSYAEACNTVKNEIDEKLGDVGNIDTALDGIIAIQNTLIGGESV
jgi:hypothetical protein